MKLRQVMVVDDNDSDLLYAEIVLESAAVAETVLLFETAVEASAFLKQSESNGVDVILLDLNMPEMNGFEFLDAYDSLYAQGQATAVVVVLTGSPNPRDRARATRYGCVKGYLIKPLDARSANDLVTLVHAGGRPSASAD